MPLTGPYSQAPSAGNLMVGRGAVLIDRFDSSGNHTGLQHVGNVTALEVSDKAEVKEKYESIDHASNLYARAVIHQAYTIKLTGDEFTLDNLARALNGVVEQITAPGATVSAAAITPVGGVALGRYYFLGFRNVTTLTDVKQGASTLVAGTDYTVDLARGLVYILPTSVTVTPGSQLTADFVYGAYTYNAVNLGTIGTVDCYLRFNGDSATGPVFDAEWWHVQFTPTGQQGFISDDFGNWELEGMVIADLVNHPTEPIGRITQIR
ncbi:MAG: hypothetical protein JSR67_03665 [Proteobacteria bacterium]|nr:hypothetical protein [Pseudomonadota bacterium]